MHHSLSHSTPARPQWSLVREPSVVIGPARPGQFAAQSGLPSPPAVPRRRAPHRSSGADLFAALDALAALR